ncbi:DUF397 domain-containing protein [Micromonospora sp. NPDC006766]|uniref:DUF397 domain-containing protein n=1 Tax=Micromonospora sp. NPDC006766 TaxID=3154778 RepID=UPI0033E418E6
MVYRELLTGALYLDRKKEISAYEEVWTSLTGARRTGPVLVFAPDSWAAFVRVASSSR